MLPTKPAAPGKAGPPSRGTFNCPDCDRPFSRKEYVERHRRLKHLGSRPFACVDCGHSFARSDLLRRHRKTCSQVPGDGSGPTAEPLPAASAVAVPTPAPAPLAFPGPALSYIPAELSTSATNPYAYHNHTYSSSGSSHNSPQVPSLSPPNTAGSTSSSANSPETPFSSDVQLEVNHEQPYCGSEQTLSLPIIHRQGFFTQDEILASEVLEDLLRSPQYGRQSLALVPDDPPPLAPFTSVPIEEEEDQLNASNTPWHGAMALQNSGQERSSVVGTWDSFGAQDNGLEFTPEAIALADYFNKGGVGGISALDLGFSVTPSLYPDHLFEPQFIHDEHNHKFFLPSQKFCIGYLYPWHVPPLKTLSRFASHAATSFLPSVPIVHPSTMVLSEMTSHTAFALTVTGAAYEKEGEGFSNEMLVEKRVFLVRGFNKPEGTEDDRFASLQSMLLYQLLGLFHRDEQQRHLSHTFHGALVMMLRKVALPGKIRATQLVTPHPGLVGEELEAAWKLWIKVETWRRVAFIVYLADLETATRFSTAPLLPFAELAIDLPSSDLLWNASTAQEWLNRSTSATNPSPVPFLDAIRALLSPNEPFPFSPDGMILETLSRLSSFPLVILSRTLSFLQMKTEEAITQVDPFRTLLSGFGIFEGREEENREVLRRIEKGRETLRRLPGGVKRGGGEGWFEGVIPQAAAGQQRGMEEDEMPWEGRGEYTMESDRVERANKVLREEFNDFLVPEV